MDQVKIIREWDSEIFHAKVLELEHQGWESRRETYRVTAEMNPETGIISHVYSIELRKTGRSNDK